ncbi:MAG: serine/threonine-protein phosphatase [Planctomycetes bacterium]|nr:serine/threonine-protein phosphatase [Planctomycetota bacterium]
MTISPKNLEQIVGGLRCTSASDVGMRRKNNQDSVAIALADSPERWVSHGHLFVVADGMGAHAAGELASKLATDNIPHSYTKQTEQLPSEAIVGAVREANTKIYTKGESSVDFQGMGTTCSCLVLLPQGALAAHVGDSRVYRLRENCFEQLTFDHSLVWEMAAASNATEDEVPDFVPKNVITRSLGPHPTVAVDLEGPFALQSGDRFLLCSDGLTGPLRPELIGMVLSSMSPSEATQSLIDLANLLGGPDNITVIAAEVFDVAALGKPTASKLSGAAGAGASSSRFSIVAMFRKLLGLTRKSEAGPPATGSTPIGPRGKSPYRRHDSTPNAENVAILSDIVRQLEELEARREWDFDWKPIHESCLEAQEAAARGDYEEAVVGFCSAVRQLMEALRNSSPERSSDSSTDL